MRPILLDTNAYAAFKRGESAILELLTHCEFIVISPVVLGELLAGFECGNRVEKNREELQSFLNSSRVRVFPINSDTSLFYSQIYSSLKSKGKPIPTNDLWIAAQAIEHGCVVCTFDKHFDSIDGLVTGTTIAELFI